MGEYLTFDSPFQYRKRGVEMKLILGANPTMLDQTLINNLKTAHAVVQALKQGRSIDQVSFAMRLPKQRLSELTKLAFLSPKITESILHGTQPASMTSDFLLKRSHLANWQDQEALFAKLG